MSRRTYGAGSLYQRADGKWVGTIEAGWSSTGARRRLTVTAATESEARKKLRERQRKIAEQGKAAATKKVTVKKWADEWVPRYRARVRPAVAVTTEGHVSKWIVPTIGTRQLAALTPGDARKIEKAILDAGRSTSTARGAISALRAMLKDARVEGHHVPDGILAMARPQLADSDRTAIPTDDAITLLRAADTNPGELVRWVLALTQAMRQAEVLGLTWDCVDLERGVIDVSWQLKTARAEIPAKFERRHLTGSYYLIRPKTTRGRRIVPLSPPAWAALRAWRDVAPGNPWGLVFTHADTRPGRQAILPRNSTVDRDAWYTLQRKAGVEKEPGRPWSLHEARHTTASLLLEAGADPHVVTAIMGHSSITTSRGYMHASTDLARRAIGDVGALLDWKAPTTDDVEATITP